MDTTTSAEFNTEIIRQADHIGYCMPYSHFCDALVL